MKKNYELIRRNETLETILKEYKEELSYLQQENKELREQSLIFLMKIGQIKNQKLAFSKHQLMTG